MSGPTDEERRAESERALSGNPTPLNVLTGAAIPVDEVRAALAQRDERIAGLEHQLEELIVATIEAIRETPSLGGQENAAMLQARLDAARALSTAIRKEEHGEEEGKEEAEVHEESDDTPEAEAPPA